MALPAAVRHRHVWLLAGKPERPARGPRANRWTIAYRCSTCRAKKRGPVNAAMMELRSELGGARVAE